MFTTWQITLKRIIQEKNGDQAKEILDIMAYLSPNSINIDLFLLKLDQLNKEKIKKAIDILNAYSMIDLSNNNEADVHRLVQEVTRINLREDNKEEET